MARGPQVVPAPAAAPPRVGLLISGNVIPGDGDWTNGYTYQPESCAGGGILDYCSGAEMSIPNGPSVEEFVPFVVWAGDKCGTFGATERDWQGRAQRLLRSVESYWIAREFWRGDLAQEGDGSTPYPTRYLAAPDDADIDIVTGVGDPAPLADAFACLEQGMGDCAQGARGTIHCTLQVASLAFAARIIERQGKDLVTGLGTLVIADAGYDGSGPGDEPPAEGSQWMYGTGPVDVRVGTVETNPDSLMEARQLASATDRELNNIEVRAWRLASASWDGCCHIAAQVDVPLCRVGGS